MAGRLAGKLAPGHRRDHSRPRPPRRQSLLVISDDKCSHTQTDQFLLFEIDAPATKN